MSETFWIFSTFLMFFCFAITAFQRDRWRRDYHVLKQDYGKVSNWACRMAVKLRDNNLTVPPNEP